MSVCRSAVNILTTLTTAMEAQSLPRMATDDTVLSRSHFASSVVLRRLRVVFTFPPFLPNAVKSGPEGKRPDSSFSFPELLANSLPSWSDTVHTVDHQNENLASSPQLVNEHTPSDPANTPLQRLHDYHSTTLQISAHQNDIRPLSDRFGTSDTTSLRERPDYSPTYHPDIVPYTAAIHNSHPAAEPGFTWAPLLKHTTCDAARVVFDISAICILRSGRRRNFRFKSLSADSTMDTLGSWSRFTGVYDMRRCEFPSTIPHSACRVLNEFFRRTGSRPLHHLGSNANTDVGQLFEKCDEELREWSG